MRIVVLGAGGVGGYFGAKLAKAGQDVVLVARGAHLQAILANGLQVRSAAEGEWTVRVPAVSNLAGQAVADIILVCVKSFDTESAAAAVRPVMGPATCVISLQNGIDNEAKLGAVLGAEQVLGAVSYVFANIAEPGVIVHHQLGRIVLGEMHGAPSARAERCVEVCRSAGIVAEATPQIRRVLWEKYLFLTALAGTTAVARAPVKTLRELPELRRLWALQVEELLTLAHADGVSFAENMMDRCTQFLESLAPGNYSSLYQDLKAGKRLELQALHGHALQLGQRLGIATPTMFAVYAALLPHAAGSLAPPNAGAAT